MIQRYKTILSKENTILLPANNHAPDTLVSMTVDTSSRSWQGLEESLHNRGEFSLTPKRIEDFLKLVSQDKVYEGNGNLLSSSDKRLEDLRKSLFGSYPKPTEVLDAKFELGQDGKIYITYHSFNHDGQLSAMIEEFLPAINCFAYKNPNGSEKSANGTHEDFYAFNNLNHQGYLARNNEDLFKVTDSGLRSPEKVPVCDFYRGVKILAPNPENFQTNQNLYAFFSHNPHYGRGTIGFYEGVPQTHSQNKFGVRPAILKSDLDRIVGSGN